MSAKCKHGIRDTVTNLPYCKRCDEDERKARSLHRLVRPFQHGNTSQWPERQRIRSALENIHDAADEASRCLEMDERLHERLDQASQAIRELEVAVHSLWPNRELSHG